MNHILSVVLENLSKVSTWANILMLELRTEIRYLCIAFNSFLFEKYSVVIFLIDRV